MVGGHGADQFRPVCWPRLSQSAPSASSKQIGAETSAASALSLRAVSKSINVSTSMCVDRKMKSSI